MENPSGKKKPTITISLFTTLSESFSLEKPAKSPRNFQAGVVGLGIVAAMTDLSNSHGHEAFAGASANTVASPKSSPIPIVSSSARAASNFRGGFHLEKNDDDGDDDDVDELSESYTCVISHHGNNLIKKRVYYDDKLNGVCNKACMVNSGVFSASPANIGELEREFWTSDFLNSCFLCKKHLHGLDIFMYR